MDRDRTAPPAGGAARRSDTSAPARAQQVAAFQRLGIEGRLAVLRSLIGGAVELSAAGIRAREPHVSPERERWLLMARRYGSDLTVAALGAEPPRR